MIISRPVNVQSIELISKKKSKLYQNKEEKEERAVEMGYYGIDECSMCVAVQ